MFKKNIKKVVGLHPRFIGQTHDKQPIKQGVSMDKPFLKDQGNSLQNSK